MLCCVLLVTGACFKSPDSTPDPCLLLTPADIEKVFATSMAPGEPRGVTACYFHGKKASQEGLTVEIVGKLDIDKKRVVEAERTRSDRTSVDGVGERAVAWVSPLGFARLTVQQKDTLLELTLYSQKQKNRLDAATQLAHLALTRLQSGSVVRESVSEGSATQPSGEKTIAKTTTKLESVPAASVGVKAASPSGQPSGATTPVGATDPCLLVTAADAERALGGPVSEGKRNKEGGCDYHLQSDRGVHAGANVQERPGQDRKSFFNHESSKTNVIRINGIADGAYAFASPAGFVNLTFINLK